MPDADKSSGVQSTNEQLRFVTITDISQRDNARNRRIVRSHAMRFAHKSIRAPLASAQAPDARSSFGVFSKDGNLSRQGPEQGSPDEVMKSKVKLEKIHPVRSSVMDYAREQEKIKRWKQWAPCPVSLLGAGRIDPFSSIPLKPKPYFDFLVDHYVNVLSPSQIPVAGPLNPLVTQMMPLARSNAILFQGIMCLSASHVSTVRGSQESGYWAKFHRTETFKHLNTALAEPKQAISDLTVATILVVSGHDVLFGSHGVHEEHMKGLDRIIAIRGGADKLGLDGLLERLFNWASHFRALRTAASTKDSIEGAEISDSPARSPGPDIVIEDQSSIVPARLMSLFKSKVISPALLVALHLLLSLTISLKDQTQSRSVVSEAAMNSFNEQRNHLEKQLNRQRERLAKIRHGSIEECVCLVTLMYSHSMLRMLPPASGTHSELNAQLKIALKKLDLTPLWGSQYLSLIWIIFMGNATTTSTSDRVWYAGLIRLIMAMHSELSPADVTIILNEFLWCPMYDTPSRELWLLAQSGHESSILEH